MTEVKGIELPGVGVRYDLVTEEGNRVGVVSHCSGRRGIYLADRDDPDRFECVLGPFTRRCDTSSAVWLSRSDHVFGRLMARWHLTSSVTASIRLTLSRSSRSDRFAS